VAKCLLGNGLRDKLGIGAGPAEDCRSCAGLTFLAASQEWHPIGTWSGEWPLRTASGGSCRSGGAPAFHRGAIRGAMPQLARRW